VFYLYSSGISFKRVVIDYCTFKGGLYCNRAIFSMNRKGKMITIIAGGKRKRKGSKKLEK